jgi:hypothetical protein
MWCMDRSYKIRSKKLISIITNLCALIQVPHWASQRQSVVVMPTTRSLLRLSNKVRYWAHKCIHVYLHWMNDWMITYN